jgi:hypothetical protein
MRCCWSRWDFVSGSTKVAILKELGNRSFIPMGNPQALVDSPVFPYIWEMFGSPDPMARKWSCQLLYNLALDECNIPLILEMRGCEQLVALLK